MAGLLGLRQGEEVIDGREINWDLIHAASQSVATMAIVPLDSDGRFCVYRASAVHSVVDVVGHIGSRTDVDAFSFTTAGGALSVTASPVAVGARYEGGELYGQRQAIIEPVFANTKFNRGIDRFRRRGRAAVRAEWRLITATHNLLKVHRHALSIV